jgi:hypothetical protein
MASLGLGIAGAALGNFLLPGIGGVIGGALGSAAGSVIDNLIFQKPAQFVDGPHLGDLSVMASSYGNPIPWLYGPRNRVALNIIDSQGLVEDYHDNTQTAGGKGGGGQSVTDRTYTYRTHILGLIGRGPIVGVSRIWANKKVIYDASGFNTFSRIEFYPGNGTQVPQPNFESIRGVGTMPAYRHCAYIYLQDFQLADFGNALPTLEVEVVAQSSITVGAVVQDICESAGVPNVSTGGLTTTVKGYTIGRNSQAIECIQPLALAYNFDAAEQRGDVRMVKRGFGLKAVLPTEDMGVHPAGDDPPDSPREVVRGPDTALPRAVTVSYADEDFDLQQGTQTTSRTKGSTDASQNQALPLTLNADEASAIADRMLFEAWAARRTATFNLGDHWIGLAPADVVGLEIGDDVVPFKITRGTRGNNGIIECEARYEDAETYSSVAPGQTPTLPTNVFVDVGDTFFYAFNGPLLLDSNDNSGFYWTAVGASSSWRGAAIERSRDGGETWLSMTGAALRGAVGHVTTTLGAGPSDFMDEANTVRVQLIFPQQTLAGVSELEMFAGSNAAWIGKADGSDGEVVGFRDAQLVTAGTYDLSGLLRGRRGTEHAIAGHGPGEIFVLLSTQTVGRTDLGASDMNAKREYRATSLLKLPEDSAIVTFTNTGEALAPFSPVHVVGARNGAGDLTITWLRRTRLSVPGLGGGPVPLGEASEAYQLDVYSDAAVVRTISTTAPLAVYTAAQQAADGLSPGVPVTVRVYQMSDVRGRGHPALATV